MFYPAPPPFFPICVGMGVNFVCLYRFAYVDLVSEECMQRIISRSEESLDGRNLLIKNGKSFEGRPAEKKQRYHSLTTEDNVPKSTIQEGTKGGRIEGSDETITPTSVVVSEKHAKKEFKGKSFKHPKDRKIKI